MTMAAAGPGATTRRARKSIAALPTSDSIFDKENSTLEGIGGHGGQRNDSKKKTRSKSLGPGGLEALNAASGNAQKLPIVPRSILKPSIPLSPPKEIPPHPSSRKLSPAKGKGGSSPARKSPGKKGQTARQSGLNSLSNPFDDKNIEEGSKNDTDKVSLKSEEQQHAAAKEREKQEAIQRRDARRKSLANRRVSFAPEATLHTWDVVELPDDATSSSEATNSTRRASSASSMPASPFASKPGEHTDSNQEEALSTPRGEEIQVAASPADERGLHQRKRRRSSSNFSAQDSFSSSPMSSVGSDDGSFMTAEDEIVDGSDSESDKDIVEREETITNIDDTTSQSVTSPKQDDNSDNTSQRLNQALQQAAEHAGAYELSQDKDEDGDVSMEMATGEVTYAFKPWANKKNTMSAQKGNLSSEKDQENVNPFTQTSAAPTAQVYEDEEMTMEVTQAVGGIIPTPATHKSPQRSRRKSVISSRRKSSAVRRRSSVHANNDDETMELTTAIGGIESNITLEQDITESVDGDEDMSMEFTSVVGGVINRAREDVALEDRNDLASQQLQVEQKNSEIPDSQEDDGMDVTTALGGILTPVTERTEPSEENTAAMDFTAAVGSILPKDLRTDDKFQAKAIMEEEADHGQLTRSPFLRQNSADGLKSNVSNQISIMASETGSPSIVGTQTRGSRRRSDVPQSTTPRSDSRQTTPMKKPTTPSKQLTPQPARPTTPSKTPPAKNVSMRKISPKRLFKQTASPKLEQPTLQFSQDSTTGLSVPSVILTPRTRRASGVGIDREGMGSPRAAAILDRRSSIGDQAASFTPQGASNGGVRFADPRELEQELDNERAEDERRESGRGILEKEVDGTQEDDKDATTSLRDMINSMTPRKNKLKGRKSLAIGAAKGLLGKRPVELDEEDEEDATPKRLKGIEHSPVKSIHLPAPPSKDETTGRLGKAPKFDLGEITGNVMTPTIQTSPERATTPKDQSRFKDTEAVRSASKPPISFNEQMAGATSEPDQEADDERIHLQDFLNMTSIRFMELTTTKRRHTVMPNKSGDDNTLPIGEQAKADDDRRLSACVVAGASTIPMLELYQHSCRELKKYISEGRNIVREIEMDTFEDNPALFREYMTASPAVRSIMDNQFKNIKTHARLLSKGMWYEWRMKLLEGLKEGLLNISNDLSVDSDIISRQEQLIGSVLPSMAKKHEELSKEVSILQEQADALANCDQEELKEARASLKSADADIVAKKEELATLQAELAQHEASIKASTDRKEICLREIEEAERIREECRGWSPSEVAILKSNVDCLEKETGWSIGSAHENALNFVYRQNLSLYLTPGAFAPHADPKSCNASISLSYIPKGNQVASTTQRFFLQLLRARVLAIHQAQSPLSHVLALVKNGWDVCNTVLEEIDSLNVRYQIEESIISDETLQVNATLLLRDLRTKLDATFDVLVGGLGDGVSSTVKAKVKVVYGEELQEGKMEEFLAKRINGIKGWTDATGELETKLKARGSKEKARG